MSRISIETLLLEDDRFQKHGSSLRKFCSTLSSLILGSADIISLLQNNLSAERNFAYVLNLVQYENDRADYLVNISLDQNILTSIITEGPDNVIEYESFDAVTLKDNLKSRYIDYKELDFDALTELSSKRSNFLLGFTDNQTTLQSAKKKSEPVNVLGNNIVTLPKFPEYKPAVEEETTVKMSSTDSEVRFEQARQVTMQARFKSSPSNTYGIEDTDYWAESVRLDFPIVPQPNVKEVLDELITDHHSYCRYGDCIIPWNQSQITSATNVNRVNNADILKLFPLIRLYTRSPYMYQQYEGLEYDDDLGVIFKVDDYDIDTLKQNIIEYPHLDFLDRSVKIKGKQTTLPFWKHIEIDGEIVSTASVWDELEDTKNLPKTESFMNEYVTRKYILDETVKGVEHKYKMRGSLLPFLTLYAPPDYYVHHGYEVLEIGRKCVEARQSFKYTRNPVVRLNQEYAELSL